MKKSELKQIIKEVIKESADINFEPEYIIWGIPKGGKHEEVLFTKAKSMSEAKKVMMVLMTKYGATKTRVQTVDLRTKPDFINAIK